MRTVRFWLVTLVSAAGVLAGIALGVWQWHRGEQKIALHAAIAVRASLAPLDARGLLALADPAQALHRPVQLRGRWLAEHQVWLDNRQMDARTGFEVLTPLQLEGTGAVVLVQRGWAPRNFEHRERLPAVDTPAGPVQVAGRLAPAPLRLYQFSAEERGRIRQNLDLARFAEETRLPLLPVTVQQVGPPSEGLLRNWPEARSGAEKNYAYAFQWWALGALIAILYVWFQFIAPRRRRSARPV